MEKLEKKVLLKKIARLEEEKADLEIMLETVTGHSDQVEEELIQKVRKMVEASEKRFRLITETIPVPVLVTQESDGIIVYANHHAASLFGIPVSSLIGRNAQEFYDPSEREEILEHIRTYGLLKNRELRGKRADGSGFQAELTIQPLHYNERLCLLSVWYDITEQRMLENRLRQSQKMEAIGTLASGIAHDFNNILTAVFGYTELSIEMVPPGNPIRRNLNQIFKAAARAKELVTQILSFCRQSEQIIKPFLLTPIVKEAVKLLRQIIPSHIRVNVSVKNPDVIIIGDPTQVHQVLINLCSNASDAMGQTGGRIDILLEKIESDRIGKLLIPELRPGPAYVRLSVMDNGPGMGKGLIERIFDPFFTTKEPGKGTGMGLAVVHGIVKNHGGAISVESEPEKGTLFNVYFPIAEETEGSRESDIPDDISGGSGRIMLIDDEKNILEIYKEILENLGYKTETQHTPHEALEQFRRNPYYYDLIITDYAMPGMTGIKLAEMLLLIRPDIPIILYSGYNDPSIREEAKQVGVRDFLSKPFTRKKLATILRKHLGAEC